MRRGQRMHYAYVIRSIKNRRLYYGYSSDLKQRIEDHNRRKGGSYSSKNAPFELIYYEAYKSKEDARLAEEFFKSGYGREVLRNKLKHSLS